MESWSYVSGGKNFVSDESVSATDGIGRSKSEFMGWELKSSSSFDNCTFMCSSQDNLKIQEFVELGGGSCNNILSNHYGCERVYNPVPPPTNALVVPGEEESCSKLSSSIVDSNCRDSSLIDLKLGRFSDHRDAQTKANPIFSSAESPIPPTKRARAGSLSSQTPFCQVHGCKKDLTSSKDYHKRHKVCEIHSKTAKVIVNGIEQRFCQQCSRFHLLAEFDDGKRSCRKRLAGHNERRRRPHIGMHSGRAGRLFQSYNGSRLHQGTSFALSSFVCQDILPNSILHPQKYEMNNDWYSRSVKVEDEGDYASHLGIPNTKGQMHTKSHLTFNSQKQCPPEEGLMAVTRTKMNENSSNSSFLHSMSTTSDFDARSLFHNSSSLGNGELTVLDSSSNVQGLPAVSNSGCALSLLSSQSQNSSNQSSGIPTALPLITTTSHSHSHYGVTQVSDKLMRVSPQTSTSAVSNAFHTSGITSAEDTQMEPILISSDGIESVNYGGINGIIHHSSPYLNAKNNVSCGDGSTIDLLQLSSQLQRVEHQRQQSMQVKQEADAFFGLRIT